MSTRLPAFCSLVALLTMPLGAVRGDEESDQLQNAVTKNASTVVTVKMVLKTEFKTGGNAQDREARTVQQGVIVSPDGLIMTTDVLFNTDRIKEMMNGSSDSSGFSMNIKPTDIKVIIEREEKEYSAFLAGTEGNLGLAFIKIEDLGDRKLTPVDFTSAANPVLGQKIVMVSRLSKGYDFAPFFETARISGELTKPRKAWLLDGNLSPPGLPVYTLSGDILGVLTLISSGVKSDVSEQDISSMMGGGGFGPFHLFVVPSPAINAAITQAKQRAVEVAAERAKNKAAAPATPPKTTPQKPAAPGKGGGKPAKP